MTSDTLHAQLRQLVSEGRNPRTTDIDLMSSLEIVNAINAEDRGVADAVGKVLPQVARAVDAIVGAFEVGGRLIYVGAGTSGRLGVLDASECPPTFGVSPGLVLGLIAAVFVGVISLGFDSMTRGRRVARAGRATQEGGGWRVNGNSRNGGWVALIGQ